MFDKTRLDSVETVAKLVRKSVYGDKNIEMELTNNHVSRICIRDKEIIIIKPLYISDLIGFSCGGTCYADTRGNVVFATNFDEICEHKNDEQNGYRSIIESGSACTLDLSYCIPEYRKSCNLNVVNRTVDRFLKAHLAEQFSAEYYPPGYAQYDYVQIIFVCGEFDIRCDGSTRDLFKLADHITISAALNQKLKFGVIISGKDFTTM